MKLYGFPGQGSQFPGMGKDLYESNALAKELFDKADAILGFSLTDIMFNGSAEDLLQTRVTQPAVFVHSVVTALCLGDDFRPDMVAGHSLGEFSALAASGALSFEDGLKLVYARALAMQECCERHPGTMAAVIGLPDAEIERVCAEVAAETGKVLVAANYNSPGNVAISGAKEAIEAAVPKMKEALEELAEADYMIIVGTSLVVQPAASLWKYTPIDCPVFVIDPKDTPIDKEDGVIHIKEKATIGVAQAIRMIAIQEEKRH